MPERNNELRHSFGGDGTAARGTQGESDGIPRSAGSLGQPNIRCAAHIGRSEKRI